MDTCTHCNHLKSKWDEALKDSGFIDAEQDKLLKKWTGISIHTDHYNLDFLFNKNDVQEPLQNIKSNWPEINFSVEQNLLNHPEFQSICESLCKHGNHTVSAPQMVEIWELHCFGLSERKIGFRLNINDTAIHRVIDKLRELSQLWK